MGVREAVGRANSGVQPGHTLSCRTAMKTVLSRYRTTLLLAALIALAMLLLFRTPPTTPLPEQEMQAAPRRDGVLLRQADQAAESGR